MKPWKRIPINGLLPPALAAALLLVVDVILCLGKHHGLSPLLRDIAATTPVVLAVAYLFGIVPSLIFAAFMEVMYRRGVSPASTKALALSGLGGLSAGAAVDLILGWGQTGNLKDRVLLNAIWGAIGAATGVLMGLIVGLAESRAASGRRKAPNSIGEDGPS
jgi:hypothetical protein